MIKHYLIITWRNLSRYKLYTGLNMLGLTIGFTCCLLITLYVREELNYDRYNKNADRIVLLQQFENNWASGGKLASDIKNRFAQVEKTVRFKNVNPLISFNANVYYEPRFYFADSTVFSVFSYELVTGNTATALKENYGVVISEAMAQKYFKGENPLGKELLFDNKFKLHVTGVMKNLPNSSHLKVDFLAAYANANELVGWDVSDNYWAGGAWTYLLLAPGTNPAAIQSQFPAYLKQLNDPNAASVWKLNLLPLRDIYLKTSLISEKPITYVYIFSITGLLILVLACFNYINLSTARAVRRAKEVGVRKVLGTSKVMLRWQFILEAAFFITGSLLFALIILQFTIPWFNKVTDKQLTLLSIPFTQWIPLLIVTIIVTSLLAGLYPSFVLSRFSAAAVLKSNLIAVNGKTYIRKILVTAQFAISLTMLVATVIVFHQLSYIKNKDLGYERNQLLTMDLRDAPANAKLLFKQKVLELPSVAAATRAYGLPGSSLLQGQKLVSDFVPDGAKDASILRLTIDEDFLKTFDIKLKEGRLLDENRAADKNVFLINEAAKKYFNWKTIDGKMTGYYTFQYKNDGSYEELPQKGEVVGVISDYNHADLRTAVQPTIYQLNDGWEGQLAIKLKAGKIGDGLSQLSALWKKSFPDKPFEYLFMDDSFNNTYAADIRTGRVFGLLALLSVIISCLGLFGLVSYMAEQKTKEIGIRKILGASFLNITKLLAKDFALLILLACIIAFPVAGWFMQEWLKEFAYRITISWWMFLMAGASAVIIAALTIGFRAVRAVSVNPVNSLRTE